MMALATWLILLGFLLLCVGVVVLFLALLKRAVKGTVEGGGVVLIGPIPFVFGTARIAKWLLVVLLILMIVEIFFLVLLWLS